MSNFNEVGKNMDYLEKAISCMYNVIYSIDEDLTEYDTEIDVSGLYEALKEIKDTQEDLKNNMDDINYKLNSIL